jgi:hypothetical protein
MTRAMTLVVALTIVAVGAGSAGAQQTGDPVPTRASVIGPGSRTVVIDTDCGGTTAYWVEPYGGMTILASFSPGGAPVARLPILFPNPRPGIESNWCPFVVVPGAPPGTYWVVMVYGLTNQTSAPPSAWTRVVVGAPACAARPLPPVVPLGSPVISGNTVALGFTGSAAGCAIDSIELEVGTTPGGSDVGVYPLTGLNTFFPNVVPGSYYARARGVNAYGKSNRSREMPLQFPGPCAASALPPMPVNPVATVNGSQLTLSWTLSPGGPAAFHQLTLIDPAGFAALDHVLLSSATTLSVPNVPPGTYRVQIWAGNACGTVPMAVLNYLQFTVP